MRRQWSVMLRNVLFNLLQQCKHCAVVRKALQKPPQTPEHLVLVSRVRKTLAATAACAAHDLEQEKSNHGQVIGLGAPSRLLLCIQHRPQPPVARRSILFCVGQHCRRHRHAQRPPHPSRPRTHRILRGNRVPYSAQDRLTLGEVRRGGRNEVLQGQRGYKAFGDGEALRCRVVGTEGTVECKSQGRAATVRGTPAAPGSCCVQGSGDFGEVGVPFLLLPSVKCPRLAVWRQRAQQQLPAQAPQLHSLRSIPLHHGLAPGLDLFDRFT